MTASVFTQGPGSRAGQQIARHSRYTAALRKPSKFEISRLETLTPSAREAAGVYGSAGEGQSHCETVLVRGRVDHVVDPHEAEAQYRANVLHETRQPLHTR